MIYSIFTMSSNDNSYPTLFVNLANGFFKVSLAFVGFATSYYICQSAGKTRDERFRVLEEPRFTTSFPWGRREYCYPGSYINNVIHRSDPIDNTVPSCPNPNCDCPAPCPCPKPCVCPELTRTTIPKSVPFSQIRTPVRGLETTKNE